jgi:hypothetical protein
MIVGYAIIDSNNVFLNAICWDGVSPYDPGVGNTIVPINEGVDYGPGYIYDPATQTFTPPAEPTP